MIKPVSPKEAKKRQLNAIPELVIEVFNDFLARRINNPEICVSQDEVLAVLKTRMTDEQYASIFRLHWLDIEPFYEAVGWNVEYDKPAYCETYEANWTFIPKKQKK